MKKLFVILMLAGVIVAGAAATIYASQAADAERQRDIAEANLVALRDTLTEYSDSFNTTLSIMQEQGDVQTDSILQLLASLDQAVDARNQTLRSLQTLRVEFARLREDYVSVTTQPVKGEPEAVEAQFNVQGPPVEGSLWVTYRPSAPWGLETDLGVTPFSATYSVGCQENNAVVNITTPAWVRATPERGTVAPDVCNPVKPRSTWSNIFRVDISNSIWFTLGGIAGYFIRDWVGDDTIIRNVPCYDDVCYDKGPSY